MGICHLFGEFLCVLPYEPVSSMHWAVLCPVRPVCVCTQYLNHRLLFTKLYSTRMEAALECRMETVQRSRPGFGEDPSTPTTHQ
jgi:hypothetical protein